MNKTIEPCKHEFDGAEDCYYNYSSGYPNNTIITCKKCGYSKWPNMYPIFLGVGMQNQEPK
jgi:hypothetical protein